MADVLSAGRNLVGDLAGLLFRRLIVEGLIEVYTCISIGVAMIISVATIAYIVEDAASSFDLGTPLEKKIVYGLGVLSGIFISVVGFTIGYFVMA